MRFQIRKKENFQPNPFEKRKKEIQSPQQIVKRIQELLGEEEVGMKEFSNLLDEFATTIEAENNGKEAIEEIVQAIENTQQENFLRYIMLKNIFCEKLNGKIPEDLIRRFVQEGESEELVSEKKETFSPEISLEDKEMQQEITSEILWEELFKASNKIDKIVGRKMGKRLRRKIKTGLLLEELLEDKKLKKMIEQKNLDTEQLKSALQEYEECYKGWRDFIEEQTEREIEIEKTRSQLETFWRENTLTLEGLEEIANTPPTLEKLEVAIFGGEYDVEAAKRLLKQIKSGEILHPSIEESIRTNNSIYKEYLEKFKKGEISFEEIRDLAKEQRYTPELAPGSKWAIVLLKDIKKSAKKEWEKRKKKRQ